MRKESNEVFYNDLNTEGIPSSFLSRDSPNNHGLCANNGNYKS